MRLSITLKQNRAPPSMQKVKITILTNNCKWEKIIVNLNCAKRSHSRDNSYAKANAVTTQVYLCLPITATYRVYKT